MACIRVDNFIEMHDKQQTFLTVIDKRSVHSMIIYGAAICVRSFEFTTGDNETIIGHLLQHTSHRELFSQSFRTTGHSINKYWHLNTQCF